MACAHSLPMISPLAVATRNGLNSKAMEAQQRLVALLTPYLGRKIRKISGYGGWGDGQLESEIGQGDWFVVEALATDLFSADASGLWRRVLRRQRGRLAMFAAYPDDVGSN